ncbi:MAG: hypothetical protein RR123_05005 [Clostridia bacterium]
MKKTRRVLLSLLVIILSFTLLFSVIACDKESGKPETDPTVEKDWLVNNGTFEQTKLEEDADAKVFPQKPETWSSQAGSIGGSSATPNDADSLIHGVIDVSDKIYKKNYSKWNKVSNPGFPNNEAKDTNVLMIYNKVATAYTYSISNVAIKKNKCYKLSVSVNTVILDNLGGAFIYVYGDAYAEFEKINTNGAWSTYNVYIEGSPTADKSITISLSLGYGNTTTGTMAKGYGFFDEVVMSEITNADYNSSAKDPVNAKFSIRNTDGEFDYTTGTSGLLSPSKYSTLSGTGTGNSAPTSSDYTKRGVVDLSMDADKQYDAIKNLGLTVPAGSYGSNILMIQNLKPTATGYRSSEKLNFASSKWYSVSIKVLTKNIVAVGDKGASLKLTTGTTEDDLNITINNIKSENVWSTYTFFIQGHTLKANNLYVEMWLGQGGSDDKTDHVEGFAFFDNLVIEEIAQDAYTNATANDKTFKGNLGVVDATANLIKDGFFTTGADKWFSHTGDYKTSAVNSNSGFQLLDTTSTAVKWEDFGIKNPGAPSAQDISKNLLMINSTTATSFDVKLNTNITAVSNQYYRVSVWVKTINVASGKGLTVELVGYDNSQEDEKKQYTSLASFTNINTESVDKDKNVINEWTELSFYIEGNNIINNQILVNFNLGKGTKLDATNKIKGIALASTLYMEEIKYSEFSSASTDSFTKKHSFISSSNTVTNGYFDLINISDTTKEFGDKVFSDGLLTDQLGLPKSWTVSNKDLLPNMNAGILQVYNSALLGKFNVSNDILKGLPEGFDVSTLPKLGTSTKPVNPNILMLNTKAANESGYLTKPTLPEVCGCKCEDCIKKGYCDGKTCNDTKCECLHKKFSGKIVPFGYTSSTISLTKDKYYRIEVWVKVANNGSASIALTTSQKNEEYKIENITNTEWSKYSFYVETGLSDISANLNLFLGNKGSEDKVSGTAYFDNVNVYEVNEEEYASKLATSAPSYKPVSYTTDSFNNYTEAKDKISTPTDWSGASVDSKAKTDSDSLLSGVFDKTKGDFDWFNFGDKKEVIKNKLFNTTATEIGNNILVINNKVATGYTYSTKSSKSLSSTEDNWYEISAWIYTYQIQKADSAYFTLKMNNKSYSFGKNDERLINTSYDKDGKEVALENSEWTKYSFFIKVEKGASVSSFNLVVGLGEESKTDEGENYAKGYAFFDNVNVKEITKTAFETAVPVTENEDKTITENFDKAKNIRIVFTKEDSEAPEPEPTPEPKPEGNKFMWLYISSGIISGVIVIVIIIYLFKRYKPKKKIKNKNLATYDKNKTTVKGKDQTKNNKDIHKNFKD